MYNDDDNDSQAQTPAPSPSKSSMNNMTMSEEPTSSPIMPEVNDNYDTDPCSDRTSSGYEYDCTFRFEKSKYGTHPRMPRQCHPMLYLPHRQLSLLPASITKTRHLLVPVPTKKPTKKPTGAPSAMPSNAATEPPVATQNVNVAIDNIQITFKGVSTIARRGFVNTADNYGGMV